MEGVTAALNSESRIESRSGSGSDSRSGSGSGSSGMTIGATNAPRIPGSTSVPQSAVTPVSGVLQTPAPASAPPLPGMMGASISLGGVAGLGTSSGVGIGIGGMAGGAPRVREEAAYAERGYMVPPFPVDELERRRALYKCVTYVLRY